MDGLRQLPRAAARVDGALQVLDCSGRCRALFGVAADGEAGCRALAAALAAAPVLGDELALATARLVRPGDEETFDWSRQDRTYEVCVCADDAGGQTFLVLFLDVTEGRRLESIQVEVRHYLEQVLADVPLGVAVLDERMRITFANGAMLRLLGRIGRSRELVDVVGAGLADLVGAEVGGRWQEGCVRARDTGQCGDLQREGFDGAVAAVLAAAAHPLHDRQGRRSGAIFIVEDVTEKAHLEAELIRMERLATVGQMVITVNHEINNPLSIISTNAQAARLLNKDLDEKTVAKLRTIEAQVKRIAEVTERLRTMDEVESNEYIADGPQMVDVWKGHAGKGDSEER